MAHFVHDGQPMRLMAQEAPPLIPIAGGTGILAPCLDLMGPNTGYHWSVRRFMSTGYSAGTVNIQIAVH